MPIIISIYFLLSQMLKINELKILNITFIQKFVIKVIYVKWFWFSNLKVDLHNPKTIMITWTRLKLCEVISCVKPQITNWVYKVIKIMNKKLA